MIDDPFDVFLADFSEDEELAFVWGGGQVTVRGIFDNSFVDSVTGETILDTTQPRITCKWEDARKISREATVMIRGSEYSVTKIEPDGTGFATVQLAHE